MKIFQPKELFPDWKEIPKGEWSYNGISIPYKPKESDMQDNCVEVLLYRESEPDDEDREYTLTVFVGDQQVGWVGLDKEMKFVRY